MAPSGEERLFRGILLATLAVLLIVIIAGSGGPGGRSWSWPRGREFIDAVNRGASKLRGHLPLKFGSGARESAEVPPATPSASATPAPADQTWDGGPPSPNELIGQAPWPGGPAPIRGRDRESVREAMNRLYSTADVDPLVTGQLYAHNGEVRHIYAQRTAYPEDDLEDLAVEQASCRSAYGLTEYNSSWGANSVGVDVGPYGLDEYAGLRSGYDDGVPPEYNLPSTPFRDYKPSQEDYYDPAGLQVYNVGLYALSVPDHDPLVGEDPPTGY